MAVFTYEIDKWQYRHIVTQGGDYSIFTASNLYPDVAYQFAFSGYSREDKKYIEFVVSKVNPRSTPSNKYLFLKNREVELVPTKTKTLKFVLPAEENGGSQVRFIFGMDEMLPNYSPGAFVIVPWLYRMFGTPKEKWAEEGLCPMCGKDGHWVAPAALSCEKHGVYAGC